MAVVAIALVRCHFVANEYGGAVTFDPTYHFGWPCSEVQRDDTYYVDGSYNGLKFFSHSTWRFSPAKAAVNLLVGVVLLISVAYVLELRRRQQRWFQFSLRGCLALMYAVGAILACYRLISPYNDIGGQSWMFFAASDYWLRMSLDPMYFRAAIGNDYQSAPYWPRLPMLFGIVCAHLTVGHLLVRVAEQAAAWVHLTPSRSHPAGGD